MAGRGREGLVRECACGRAAEVADKINLSHAAEAEGVWGKRTRCLLLQRKDSPRAVYWFCPFL